MKRITAALFGGAIGLAFIVACSSSDDAKTGKVIAGACSEIANRCHPWDSKSTLAHDCHETGHDAKDDTKCSSIYDACLAECPETDAALPFQIVDGQVVNDDAGSDGGDAAAVDAGPDLCTPYCDCVVATCSTNPKYPYGDAGASDQKATCIATCKANLSTEQVTCWTKHCGVAKDLSEADRGHECFHSIGLEGLDECD